MELHSANRFCDCRLNVTNNRHLLHGPNVIRCVIDGDLVTSVLELDLAILQ